MTTRRNHAMSLGFASLIVRVAIAPAAMTVLGALPMTAYAAGAPSEAGSSAGFVMTVGRDTIGLERFTRTAGGAQGTLLFTPTGLRFDYTLEIGADGLVKRMENTVRPASAAPNAPPTQSATLEWRADSVIADVPPGGLQRFASKPGSLPYLNPSLFMLELIVKRAGAHSPPSGTVPVFTVSGGRTIDATLRFAGSDSLELSLGAASFQLKIDARGHILSGAVPAQNVRFERVESLPPAQLAVAAPDYSAPAGAPYTAESVRVSTRGGFELAGTLTRPVAPKGSTAKLPCVITITGSGPQDRDERLPIVRGYRLFRQVADTLSRRGIAVLRLDDRGTGESGGRFAGSTTADFGDDVQDALAWLRVQPGIDATRLALLGHSEGGLIAPMVAVREPTLAALVLLAGPAWNGRRVLEYQNAWAIGKQLTGAAFDSTMAVAKKGIDSLATSDAWFGYFLGYDPLPAARRVVKPHVLLLQGETDRQVTAEQVDELAAAFKAAGNRDVTVKKLAATNHLFLPDPSGDPAGYAKLSSGEVPRETLGLIADWLAARLLPGAHGTHTVKLGVPTPARASPPPHR
jgi:alpha-beta hydrolase superfamily lysophospholipase